MPRVEPCRYQGVFREGISRFGLPCVSQAESRDHEPAARRRHAGENRCGGTAPLAAAGGVACGSGNLYRSGEHHAPLGSGTHDRPV